jgi:hypothetical protein
MLLRYPVLANGACSLVRPAEVVGVAPGPVDQPSHHVMGEGGGEHLGSSAPDEVRRFPPCRESVMTMTRPAGGLWSGRQARLTTNASRAIYGTIVATALIGAVSAHENNPGRIALAVLVTLLVFWLAHVYSGMLEHGLRQQHAAPAALRATMADEFAMVEAPVLSIVILLLGWLGWLGDRLAINLALANGVVQLFLWGVAVARRWGRPRLAALVAGLVNAGFGMVIVLLEALLH